MWLGILSLEFSEDPYLTIFVFSYFSIGKYQNLIEKMKELLRGDAIPFCKTCGATASPCSNISLKQSQEGYCNTWVIRKKETLKTTFFFSEILLKMLWCSCAKDFCTLRTDAESFWCQMHEACRKLKVCCCWVILACASSQHQLAHRKDWYAPLTPHRSPCLSWAWKTEVCFGHVLENNARNTLRWCLFPSWFLSF